MRTEGSSARIKKKKRSSERSKRHDKSADEGEWKQFTSPDGHPYFYNAVTKESRWELLTESVRSEHRQATGGNKQVILEEEEDEPLEQDPGSKKDKKKRPKGVAVDKQEAKDTPKSKNATFQKLQASLEGRFNAMNGPMMGTGRPPPMLSVRRWEEDFAGGATESETKTPSLEEQYEAETVGMSAAERLRFLRKKRQENMMTKRESVSGDDFMAEVASNMKKKEAIRKPQEKNGGDKVLSWKEKEEAEGERKRQQMQAEMEVKEQEEARKEREQQAAIEREQRREQDRAEQLALEQRREQERKQQQDEKDIQRQQPEERQREKKQVEAAVDGELDETSSEHEISKMDVAEPGAHGQLSSDVLPGDSSGVSSPERVNKHRRRSRESKRGGSFFVAEENDDQQMSTEHEHPSSRSKQSVVSEDIADAVLDEKQRAREERRARKLREKELSVSLSRASVTPESPRRKSISSAKDESSTRSTSSIEETEEEIRAREKQLRREKRRMAKVEAVLAAQNLGEGGGQGDAHHKRDRKGSPGGRMEQHEDQSSNSTNGSWHAGASMNGQPHPGQVQLSGGMYAPYPYMMMPPPPPPPPTPYGYYYPYMQPPPMMSMYPPGMVGVPPGYQLMPPTPPSSLNGMGVPSAMVPYGADSTPFSAMYGQQPDPELNRCECCKGIGVGLVEKNGVCAHCNRLRLAFIVDSAQMRQRCSVCGGWGFQLLQANGMCEHCTRRIAQKSQRKLVTEAQHRSSLAAPLAASVPVSTLPRRNSTGNPKNEGLDDINWDKSSSGDSDWDD
ncbi:hypothetical protein PRIC1_011459 [Phytophthora ramorum]